MGAAPSPESQFSETVREHVLSPLETAHQRARREYEEVRAERRAYTQFKKRASDMNAVPTPPAHSAPAIRSVDTFDRGSIEQLRSAFRATVMSVDHYDDLYGESLDEHIAAELSPDIVTLLQTKNMPFTKPARTALIDAVNRAITQRDLFFKLVEREHNSVENSHTTLIDLLNTYGRPRISDQYHLQVKKKLGALAKSRQETLRSRPSTARANGHDLCQYLYQDSEWTYPILIALARFQRRCSDKDEE